MHRLWILTALFLVPAAAAQDPNLDPEDPLGTGTDAEQGGDTPAAPGDPVGSGDDGVDWGSGLVWGLGLGGIGLAAVAGALYYLGVGGLRHIDKHNVLDHPMRQSLLDVVETEPGVHLRELANRHDTAVTNTQWHLRKLEMAGLVKTQKVQGRRLYYPTRGGAAAKDQAVRNAAIQNPNAKKIMDYLQGHPGTNQRTLAENLDMNPGTVRWHLRKMQSAEMVRIVQDGTQTCYFPVAADGEVRWDAARGEAVAVDNS